MGIYLTLNENGSNKASAKGYFSVCNDLLSLSVDGFN